MTITLLKSRLTDIAQKTKIKWSVEGDENSRFFHGMLNKKRSQLNIRGVIVDRVWTENPSDVKREFFQHFRSRFDRPKESRAYVDMCYPICLSIEQHEDLERYVSKEELKRAMWDCGTDKSPGPNGFTFGFYRHFWSTMENDVFVAVNHFLTYGDIHKGCNSSFIALISKVPDANLVKDFRPISLIGSIYKIIAKILANRIVGVLGDIVNEVQSAFIGERQILDGPFILNEVLQWCKLKKKQSLIFKVDFEKAYDSVRWDFLDDILKKFGFGNKWCAWIQSCLRSSRGLRINMSKSKIMGVHVEDEKVGKDTNTGVWSCWTNIVNEIKILRRQGVNVLDVMRLKLGNGDMTTFWDDNWIGGGVLKDLYPRIYALETCKTVNVSTKLNDSSLDNSFRRRTRGGVCVVFGELGGVLGGFNSEGY
uniref:RNA-directed DNA polymerase, eukaryota, reverse transcriptase zinc-binding domain protein n=1 Tax=Tanacetum cinerariifolium TaxID=118510 RepID=A0A6L2N4Z2_TANCI|nr:RNA-directed DNA polymerase, eukaryota, reverse transcriptase zinc-binding domain protein [Tanacetum cinerariifolium]